MDFCELFSYLLISWSGHAKYQLSLQEGKDRYIKDAHIWNDWTKIDPILEYSKVVVVELLDSKVPLKWKAWGLRPKSHMILIEIKIEARYLKRNNRTPQGKNRENLNRSNTLTHMAIGPITSCFSVERERDFKSIIDWKKSEKSAAKPFFHNWIVFCHEKSITK